MNTSRMPVSVKSISVVRKVALWTGSSPRAASTASALLSMVPPTQKPSALMVSAPVMSCVTPIALRTASSM
ncbi:hypothetical protein D3C72_2518290 [compost metagenome]